MLSQRSTQLLEPSPSNASTLLVRNDYFKALHIAMLQRLGVEATRSFWSRHPLERNGVALTPEELADHLWREEAFSPVSWSTSVVNDIEPFLLEHGVGFEDFLETTRHFANHGSFVHSRHMLAWLSPILVALYRFGDPYRLILHAARLSMAKLSPGVTCELVSWHRDEIRHEATQPAPTASLWMSYPGLPEGRVPPWDFTWVTGRPIQTSPRIFGLPAFESLLLLCDARPAQSVPWDVPCAVVDGYFLIGDSVHGRLLRFSQFCRETGYDLTKYTLLDPEVVMIERDYGCPRRGRVVLSAGCAYGAPGYLARLGWSDKRTPRQNFLSHVLDEGAGEPSAAQARFEALHDSYLELVTTIIPVVYSTADESLLVAGRYICRGIPARIMRECVRISRDEGRREFTFRELKRKRELVSHPKNTGFEIRLRRLREALSAADCGVGIESTGRGSFALVCPSRLSLKEVG